MRSATIHFTARRRQSGGRRPLFLVEDARDIVLSETGTHPSDGWEHLVSHHLDAFAEGCFLPDDQLREGFGSSFSNARVSE